MSGLIWHKKKKKVEGFTILEMLVVIALLALISGLSFSLSGHRTKSVDLESATSHILGALRLTRTAAISRNTELLFWFDSQRQIYGSPVIETRNMPRGITIHISGIVASDNAAVVSFIFFPNGTSSGGELLLRSGDQHSRIYVNWLMGIKRAVP